MTPRKSEESGPKDARCIGKDSPESRVFDSLPSHIAILDEKAYIVKTNKAWRDFAALNGLKRDFSGENYLEVCDHARGVEEEMAREAAVGLRSAIAGERDFFSLDYPLHSNHGKRWFQMRVIRLVDEEPAHFAVAHLEITRQKQAEESLRENEEKFRRITENMRDVVCQLDDMGRICYASPSYRHVLGYEPEDLVGKSPFPRFHPEDLGSVLASFRESMESGKPADVSFRYLHAQGHYVWLHSYGNFLYDENRKITGAVISSRNITRGKMAEEALRKSEERFRSVAESTNDWIWEVDSNARYTFAGSRIEELLGYRPEEVIGRRPFEFMPPEEAARVAPIFRVIQAAGKPFSFLENVNLHKDGHRVVLESSGVPILDAKGNLVGYRGADHDVTHKRALEAQALRVRHLASIGELAAGVGHEINNPVTGIINYAQILADEAGESGGNTEIPKKIMKEGERIASIVRNLLFFAGEIKAEKQPIRVLPALEDSIALTASLFRKDGIHVKVDIPDGIPTIVANRKEIQHVFLNVLANSRYALNKKYKGSHKDKIVRITAEALGTKGMNMVRVVFFDTGTGISPKVLSRIFDPFFSTKSPDEAAGLGLSITYGIVKDHRGKIDVESSEGEFTKVILDFPAGPRTEELEASWHQES